jgi:hypothetical protein
MTTQEIIETTVTNIVSWTIVAATFNYSSLIPSTENIIQWSLGLCVMVSVMTYNAIRSIQAYDDWKQKRRDRKAQKP